MYARIASFEGRTGGISDDMIERMREHGPRSIPAARGFIALSDPEGGTSLGITFFDTEQAIRDSEQAFEDMAQHFAPGERGRRTSVDTYEVTIQEVDDGATAARVSSLEGSPDRIDESVSKARDEVLPKARDVPGWKGIISLADRTSGRVKLITFWESQDALRASEEQANRLREQAADAGGQRITGVVRYEVALADRLSEVHA